MLVIRYSKIIVVLSCVLLGGLPGFNNILDYDVNLVHVQHVMMMDTHVLETSVAGWRSIESPWLQTTAYVMIILAELSIFVIGMWGVIDMWKARKNTAAFNASKSKAILALSLGILVWFTGFLVIGGEWFLMWLSEDWNSQQAAFRLVLPFILSLIYLSMKDEDIPEIHN